MFAIHALILLLQAVMQCLGEMIAHLPVSGGHITLARRFVGNEMAFAVGEPSQVLFAVR